MRVRASKKVFLTVVFSLFVSSFFSTTSFASPSSIPSSGLDKFVGTSLANHVAEYHHVGIGDFNCDGDKDIILAAGGWNSERGRVYVYFGGSSFSGTISLPADLTLGSADLAIHGNNAGDLFGSNLQILDTNEDGCDDIIVRAVDAGPANYNYDSFHVIFGDSSWTGSGFNNTLSNVGPSLVVTVSHTQADTYHYLHILGAIDGDVNADGNIDNRDKHLAVCSPGYNNGTCLLMPITNVLNGGTFQSVSTHYVSAVDPSKSITSGDFNNDGTPDLVFGNPDALYNHSVTIIYGPISDSPSRLVSTSASPYLYVISNYFQANTVLSNGTNEDIVVWDVNSPNFSVFGEFVASGKLFDTDYDDLVIGSHNESCGPSVQAGRFHIISGESLEALRENVSGTSTGIEIYSDTATGTYNYSDVDVVLFGGDQGYAKFGGHGSAEVNIDLNGDGQKDFIAGGANYTADPASPQFKGIVHIVYGGDLDSLIGGEYALGAASPYSAEYLQGGTNHFVGTDIVAGDYTGDGIDDAIILAAGAGPGGTAYLLPGEATDEDGDGFLSATDPNGDGAFTTYDCNDKDATLFPETFYADADGDGFGDVSNTIEACGDIPTGYVADASDCDDTLANISPSVSEICDGVDNNCSGGVDEGLTLNTYYADTDNDGFGSTSSPQVACEQPTGYVTNNTDCNDAVATISPSANEICDSIDNNCSGSVDEGLTTTYYLDNDGDGIGSTTSQQACSAPASYVLSTGDCNNASNTTYPGATELCDNVDNDCDGTIDNNITYVNYYTDGDGDGFGNATAAPVNSCSQPSGSYVQNNTDCNDALYDLNNNCTPVVVDNDNDGFSVAAGDCNDNNNLVYPGAGEYCDAIDNNCDGTIDEDTALDVATWYFDSDGDGLGDSSQTVSSCAAPAGYVAVTGDCDDSDAANNCNDNDADTYTVAAGDCDDNNIAVYPGATEIGDGFDNDCDGKFDENLMKVKVNSSVGSVAAGDDVALNIFYLNNTGFQNFNVQVYILRSSYQDYASPNPKKLANNRNNLNNNPKTSLVATLNPWYRTCGTNNQYCTLIGSANSQNLSDDGYTHSFSIPVNLPSTLDSGETYGLFVKVNNPQTGLTQFTITAYNDTVRNSLGSTDSWYNDAVDLLAMVE